MLVLNTILCAKNILISYDQTRNIGLLLVNLGYLHIIWRLNGGDMLTQIGVIVYADFVMVRTSKMNIIFACLPSI